MTAKKGLSTTYLECSMEVHGVKTENETQNHQSKKLIIKKLKEGKICSRKQGFIVDIMS